MLDTSSGALCDAYDLAMLDLDGVVYVGPDAVPGAAEHLDAARGRGMRLAFITNNASRTPDAVADQLRSLGVAAEPADVVTSAQAAARVLRDELGPDIPVVVLGADGLREAVVAAGLVPVGVEEEAAAVVTGYGPDIAWRDIMRVAVRIRDGLRWVASNTDHTIPTAYGVAPGHGVQVDMLRSYTGVEPLVAGKPQRPLLDETIRRVGGEHPLMVGDRLDTDIAGARNVGIDALLVLTGVTGLPELVAARPDERPTYLASDLGGLTTAHTAPEVDDATVTLAGWRATVSDGRLEVDGAGDRDDWWRAVAVAAWRWLDERGEPVDTSQATPPEAP